MPLTEKVSFTAVLQKGNRIQVPRVVRWRFKMDTEQVLKAAVFPVELMTIGRSFYARMDKSRRIIGIEILDASKNSRKELTHKILNTEKLVTAA
jgi:hypothetical protein